MNMPATLLSRMRSILSERVLADSEGSTLVRQCSWILEPASYLAVATIWMPSSPTSFSKAVMISMAASTFSFPRSARTMGSRSSSLMDTHLTSSGLSPSEMTGEIFEMQDSRVSP